MRSESLRERCLLFGVPESFVTCSLRMQQRLAAQTPSRPANRGHLQSVHTKSAARLNTNVLSPCHAATASLAVVAAYASASPGVKIDALDGAYRHQQTGRSAVRSSWRASCKAAQAGCSDNVGQLRCRERQADCPRIQGAVSGGGGDLS